MNPIRDRLEARLVGGWGIPVSRSDVSRLWWFWLDGAFANGYDSICTTYLAIYVATLGATSAQVGAMASLGGLAAAIMLLPGALLAERVGHRKQFVLIVGFGARLMLLGFAGLPMLLSGQPLVFTAIVCSILRDGLNFFAFPAWVSLSGDIVPADQRGRYFGSRTFASTVTGVVVVYVCGTLITLIGVPNGYMVAFAIAFVMGLASSYSFFRIHDPHPEAAFHVTRSAQPGFSLRRIFSVRAFSVFCLTSAVFNFSLNIAGPFFNLYLVKELHATPTEVGALTVATSITTLLSIGFFGRLSDRYGSHLVATITGLTIPLLPFAWVFVTYPWHVLPINLASGFLWAGYNLSMFNLLLGFTPDEERARFSAIYQIVVTLSLAGGAAIGGWVATQYSFQTNFLLSGIGRLMASVLFLLFVPALNRNMQSQ
jgi:MFS family permease